MVREREGERDREMTEAASFSALLRSTISTGLCSTHGDASSTQQPLRWQHRGISFQLSFHIMAPVLLSPGPLCVRVCVCSTWRIVSHRWLLPVPL